MNMPLPGNVPSQHQERLTDYRVPSEESQEAPLPQAGKNRHPSDLLKPPWVIQACLMYKIGTLFKKKCKHWKCEIILIACFSNLEVKVINRNFSMKKSKQQF